jgi:hypothetical protein
MALCWHLTVRRISENFREFSLGTYASATRVCKAKRMQKKSRHFRSKGRFDIIKASLAPACNVASWKRIKMLENVKQVVQI